VRGLKPAADVSKCCAHATLGGFVCACHQSRFIAFYDGSLDVMKFLRIVDQDVVDFLLDYDVFTVFDLHDLDFVVDDEIVDGCRDGND